MIRVIFHSKKMRKVEQSRNVAEFPPHFLKSPHSSQQLRLCSSTLHIYDFDGTLCLTPEPANGKFIYKRKMKKHFPAGYWWDMEESLDLSVFDIGLGPAHEAYLASVESVNTCTLMMTGRKHSLSRAVVNIMDRHGITPALSIFRPNTHKSSTMDYKKCALETLVQLFENVKRIVMWDDRIEHVETFRGLKLFNHRLKCNVKMTVHHAVATTDLVVIRPKTSQITELQHKKRKRENSDEQHSKRVRRDFDQEQTTLIKRAISVTHTSSRPGNGSKSNTSRHYRKR